MKRFMEFVEKSAYGLSTLFVKDQHGWMSEFPRHLVEVFFIEFQQYLLDGL
jgi:hypothetical protein